MDFPTPRRCAALLALAATPAAAVLATTGSSATAAAKRTVVLKDIAFSPAKLVVSEGTTVTWKWDDGRVQHNVRSVGSNRFKGSALKATGTHRVTLRKTGTYRYTCTVHPGMDGSVRVR